MPITIEHFMWGYQHLFRLGVQQAIERICEALGLSINPRVFLVGVRIHDDGTRHAACVEPELDHWAQSADLYGVLDDISEVVREYPEFCIMQSHPIAQDRENQRLFVRAVRDRVRSRLERSTAKPQSRELFISDPKERDGFLIMTVIEVDAAELQRIPTVQDATIRIHEHRSFEVPRSLFEAAILVLLSEAASAIMEPEAGSELGIFGSTDDLLRKAGLRYFAGLVRRIDREAIYVGVAEQLFDSIVRLSLAPYESSEACGVLLFAEAAAIVGTDSLKWRQPVPFESRKAVRKLLVLTGGDTALLCDSHAVHSLIDLRSMEAGSPRTLLVELTGRAQWRAQMDGQSLMVMRDGHPRLPTPVVDQRTLKADLRRLIPGMSEEIAARLAAVGKGLVEAECGAVLAIAAGAPLEAVRLQSDGVAVEPQALSLDLAKNLSQIDGALLCDEKGELHAVGVILDGMATGCGDRGRGSRYNSSLRYALAGDSRAVLVFSEDGGMDLLPKLRPTLSESQLLAKIEELRVFARSDGTEISRERESEAIRWLERHSFYMTADQCDEVNGLIEACDERWKSRPDVSVWMRRSKLHPDAEFRAARDLLP